MTIASATYYNGLALNSDGAVYVIGNDSGVRAATDVGVSGAEINGGLVVDKDGQLIVRFV